MDRPIPAPGGTAPMESQLAVTMASQPDDTTCGPTCLHAVYRYYGEELGLLDLIGEVSMLEEGGTLAVSLGSHALQRDYQATIFTYNLQLFDPTWFGPDGRVAPGVDLAGRLRAQADAKDYNVKLLVATQAYLDFLALGGRIRYEDLTPGLIRRYLNRQIPLLTGLSSTYLYQHAREWGPRCDHDDVRGEPAGHFVVLGGYHREDRQVLVNDPLLENPFSRAQKYLVSIDRLICAILLGIITYDANLLIIEPQKKAAAAPATALSH